MLYPAVLSGVWFSFKLGEHYLNKHCLLGFVPIVLEKKHTLDVRFFFFQRDFFKLIFFKPNMLAQPSGILTFYVQTKAFGDKDVVLGLSTILFSEHCMFCLRVGLAGISVLEILASLLTFSCKMLLLKILFLSFSVGIGLLMHKILL